jgi:hypothetical protein
VNTEKKKRRVKMANRESKEQPINFRYAKIKEVKGDDQKVNKKGYKIKAQEKSSVISKTLCKKNLRQIPAGASVPQINLPLP